MPGRRKYEENKKVFHCSSDVLRDGLRNVAVSNRSDLDHSMATDESLTMRDKQKKCFNTWPHGCHRALIKILEIHKGPNHGLRGILRALIGAPEES